MVVVLKGKGVVGRLIVGGIVFPKLGFRFGGLLIPLLGSLKWSFISISSPFNREHILGNGTTGDSCNVILKDLEAAVISEDSSLLVVVVGVVEATTAEAAFTALKVGNSNTGGEVINEEADVSSISLSFSIALASSESLHGACMS